MNDECGNRLTLVCQVVSLTGQMLFQAFHVNILFGFPSFYAPSNFRQVISNIAIFSQVRKNSNIINLKFRYLDANSSLSFTDDFFNDELVFYKLGLSYLDALTRIIEIENPRPAEIGFILSPFF